MSVYDHFEPYENMSEEDLEFFKDSEMLILDLVHKIKRNNMPYIKQDLREELELELNALKSRIMSVIDDPKVDRAGILNYIITDMLDTCYGPLSTAKYKDYNEAIGMLECCKLEFYRKAAAPYEDMKEKQNGSVLDGETRKGNYSRGVQVKREPIEMMLTKPSEGFDAIIEPGITMKQSNVSFKYGFHQGKLEHNLNEKNKTVNIFKVSLTPGVTAFIKAKSFLEAACILKDILLSPEYGSLNHNDLGAHLKLYKSYESLEAEIKNVFTAKERDNLDSNFAIFLKVREQ